MFKRKNNFYFFAYWRLKFFWLPDRFAPGLGQSGHSTISLSEILLMLSWGKAVILGAYCDICLNILHIAIHTCTYVS